MAATAESVVTGYHFGDFEIDLTRGCLLRAGQELSLRYQSFQVLCYFAEHPETLLTKDELVSAIWTETAVTDNALVQCIADIRRDLGDDPHNPRYIKTVAKVGYRLIAPVTIVRAATHWTETTGAASTQETEQPRIPGPGVRPRGNSRLQANAESNAETTPLISHRAGTAADGLLRGRKRTLPAWLTSAAMVAIPLLFLFGDEPLNQDPPRAQPSASGPPTLVVFPLANATGNPDMNWLREGLSDLIVTDLENRGKWNVLSRTKMHSLMGDTSPAASLPLGAALAIAGSVHATDFVEGTISSSGPQVIFSVDIRDGRDGRLVASDNASLTDPREIVSEAAWLSTGIARRLGFSGDEPPQLANVMTGNVDAYRYYSLGMEKAEQWQDPQAIDLFKKAIHIDPRFAMAYARIGYVYTVRDFQPGTGRPYLEEALRLSSSLPTLNRLYIDAWFAISRSDYDAASGVLQQITLQYPEETEATCELARLLRSQERVKEAASMVQSAIAQHPDDQELYNSLGLMLMSLDRYPEAISAYRQYVALTPEDPNAHDSLGMAYQQAGQYQAALGEYNQALALDPEFEPAIVHLGDTFYQMCRYQDALHEYRRYIDVTASSNAKALGYGDIATTYLAVNKFPEAEAAAAAEIRYNRYAVWNAVEIALARHRNLRAAALEPTLFEHLPDPERGAPRDLRTEFYYRATIELQNGDAQGALGDFKSALEHLPPSSSIDSHEDCLANAYLALGMNAEAVVEYERILKLNPNYPLAWFHLAQAYQKLHRQQEAAAAFQHFLQANPTADQDSPPVLKAREGLGFETASR